MTAEEKQTSQASEFEREPVPRGALLGFKSFLGMYAGEHCAGTELMIGAIATAAGMFPAIAMKLLGFVALYGMLLMPMGAVVFVDYWLIKKFGLQSYYAEVSGEVFNWAAGLAWFLTLGACWYLVQYAGIEIFFVSLPGWFVAAILYIVISAVYQKKVRSGIA